VVLASEPAQLVPARSQMAFTLGFHIILVPIGVALPTIMLIANYKGLRHNDPVALTLARRWSHAAAVTFAVGAVTGTVLSFEMGPLWPGLTGTYGDVFGLPFQIEAISFMLEAILIAIYIYGWKRLRPWTHFWLGFPIPFVAIAGAFAVISANSWMNQPAGFTLGPDGRPTDIDPWGAIFNAALPYELPHFLLAAYMAAGFTVASIYVVGWLRGRRDRYHRLGILIPFTVAAIATPVQMTVGDTTARQVFHDQPVKFAAMEVVTETGSDQPEVLFGRYDSDDNTVSGGISIPGLNSILAGFSRDTEVHGLDSVDPADRPSNVTLVHWAFDIMVGIGTLLLGLVAWFAIALLAAPRPPQGPPVSVGGRGLGRALLHRDRVRLDRHRGGPPALDRLQHRAHSRRRHHVREHLADLRRDRRHLRRHRHRDDPGAAGDVAPLAAPGRRRCVGALRAPDAPGPALTAVGEDHP
jgi:cytochrome d ubiquinol oxidase subunit I